MFVARAHAPEGADIVLLHVTGPLWNLMSQISDLPGLGSGSSGLAIQDDPTYCRCVITAAALAGACLFIAAGLAWTARLVHVGTLDAMALADKLAAPEPFSVLDWPELHVRAVVPPDVAGELSLVLLLVEWPARREQATLLVDLGPADQRSLSLLSQWCAARASVAPGRCGPGQLELRRRQSLERVRGLLVAEDAAPALGH